MKNVISSSDFTRKEIEGIFSVADSIKKGRKPKVPGDKVIALTFFEPSTRTFTSFDVAAKRLGFQTTGFRWEQETSVAKEETFADTVRMFSSYADCLVIRHRYDGAARFASQVTGKPIINAGDGKHDHPTQSLLDLYTIKDNFGKIDGLTYCVIGDLKNSRTMHSLLRMLTKFKPKRVYLVSPKQLRLRKEFLSGLNYKYEELDSASKILEDVDVFYVNRIQKERYPDEMEYKKVKGVYVVTPEMVGQMKDSAIILDPLPMVDEIDKKVNKSKKAKYFEQAANGLPIRMAVLAKVLGA